MTRLELLLGIGIRWRDGVFSKYSPRDLLCPFQSWTHFPVVESWWHFSGGSPLRFSLPLNLILRLRFRSIFVQDGIFTRAWLPTSLVGDWFKLFLVNVGLSYSAVLSLGISLMDLTKLNIAAGGLFKPMVSSSVCVLIPVQDSHVGRDSISELGAASTSLNQSAVGTSTKTGTKDHQRGLRYLPAPSIAESISGVGGRMISSRAVIDDDHYSLFMRIVTLAYQAALPGAPDDITLYARGFAYIFPPEKGDSRTHFERFLEFAVSLSQDAPTPIQMRFMLETDLHYRRIHKYPAANYDVYKWRENEKLSGEDLSRPSPPNKVISNSDDLNRIHSQLGDLNQQLDQFQRSVTNFLHEQAAESHIETRNDFVDITQADLSPASRILGIAIMALKDNPSPLAEMWCELWESERLLKYPPLSGDMRTPAEKLYAFVRAAQVMPSKEVDEFMESFDRRFRNESGIMY